MMIDREQRYRDMAMRGKYRRLYAHLCGLGSREWNASFSRVPGSGVRVRRLAKR